MSKAMQNGHSRPRSALGRGSRPFLTAVDLRTIPARRHRDLYDQFTSQIGTPTVWQKLTIETLCDVVLALESMRAATACGRRPNLKQMDRLASRARQLAKDLALSIPDDSDEEDDYA